MKNWLKNVFAKRCTVRIFMKSGNVIVADRVREDFTVRTVGDTVTGISAWNQRRAKNKLMLSTLALDQIEAITHT